MPFFRFCAAGACGRAWGRAGPRTKISAFFGVFNDTRFNLEFKTRKMDEGCTHGPREGVHAPVHLFSKIWTRRPRPWGARFAEISPFQESGSRNFLDPEPICQPTFDLGIFSAPVFCRGRAFSALVRLFRIVSASFPRPEIGVGAPFPRSHRNDEPPFLPRPNRRWHKV